MNSNNGEVVHYLSAADLYTINDEVTQGDAIVRDLHLLDSAVKRPKLVVFGEAQFPTLIDKAASLLHSVAYHHLFIDGNKRTALRAVTLFLARNGYELTWGDTAEYEFILEIAKGQYDVEAVAERLRPYVRRVE